MIHDDDLDGAFRLRCPDFWAVLSHHHRHDRQILGFAMNLGFEPVRQKSLQISLICSRAAGAADFAITSQRSDKIILR